MVVSALARALLVNGFMLKSSRRHHQARSGCYVPADRKWVAYKPAPCTVWLTARNLDRVDEHRLGRRHRPLRVHQRDFARPNDLPDLEIKDSLRAGQRK